MPNRGSFCSRLGPQTCPKDVVILQSDAQASTKQPPPARGDRGTVVTSPAAASDGSPGDAQKRSRLRTSLCVLCLSVSASVSLTGVCVCVRVCEGRFLSSPGPPSAHPNHPSARAPPQLARIHAFGTLCSGAPHKGRPQRAFHRSSLYVRGLGGGRTHRAAIHRHREPVWHRRHRAHRAASSRGSPTRGHTAKTPPRSAEPGQRYVIRRQGQFLRAEVQRFGVLQQGLGVGGAHGEAPDQPARREQISKVRKEKLRSRVNASF